ncbi:MAG TPA: hypothetical protein VE907_07200 [Gammaproteobacteria bacterium]|nr:hypothetical protein [Gammaproteobacteria bacterium]
MLKIQRNANGEVVLTVIGQLELHNLDELLRLVAAEPAGRSIVLDLRDLVLVDSEAVRFLRRCERRGIALRNCAPYIRIWMAGGDKEH